MQWRLIDKLFLVTKKACLIFLCRQNNQRQKIMIYIDNKVRVRARLLGKTINVGSFPATMAERVKAALEPEISAIEARALKSFQEAVDKAASGKTAPESSEPEPEVVRTCRHPDKYGLTKVYASDENDVLVNCPKGFESFYDNDVPEYLFWCEPGKSPKYKTAIS